MKKENKKLAQQKRAKERKVQAVKDVARKVSMIVIPVLAFALLVGIILFNPFVKEPAVEMGDTVNIDFVGKIDGVAFEGGTSKGYDLVIGSNSFIDDFEAQLVGTHVGDKVNVNVTFPKDYHEAKYQGKDAVFEVKINSITKP